MNKLPLILSLALVVLCGCSIENISDGKGCVQGHWERFSDKPEYGYFICGEYAPDEPCETLLMYREDGSVYCPAQ